MKRKWHIKSAWLCVLLAAVLLLGSVCWMLYPRSLAAQFPKADRISVALTQTSMTGSQGMAVPVTDGGVWEFSAGSAEYEELLAILNQYTYHSTPMSLFLRRNYTLKRQSVSVMFSDGDRQLFLTDGGGMAVGTCDGSDRLYAVGYFGTRRSVQLLAEVQAFLQKYEPVSAGE